MNKNERKEALNAVGLPKKELKKALRQDEDGMRKKLRNAAAAQDGIVRNTNPLHDAALQ